MEIKPNPDKYGKALVTFDNLEERWQFGNTAPFFSLERQRLMSYIGRGMLPWGIVGNYGNREFPQTVSIPHGVIGHVAGELALKDPVHNPEAQAALEAISAATLGYLEERRETTYRLTAETVATSS